MVGLYLKKKPSMFMFNAFSIEMEAFIVNFRSPLYSHKYVADIHLTYALTFLRYIPFLRITSNILPAGTSSIDKYFSYFIFIRL